MRFWKFQWVEKLSTTYKTRSGDTFEVIARREYGDEQQSTLIARANAGVTEPLSEGTTVTIPALPDDPANRASSALSGTEDEIGVLIGDKRFQFFDSLRVVRSIDTMDVVELGFPLETTLPHFRESFRPLSFSPVDVTIGGVPLFTGTAVSVVPVLENVRKVISVGGYSLPGVLMDCTPPASAFPLEFNELGLKEIAETLAAPFGIGVEFRDEPDGGVFRETAIDPGIIIFTFLADLAKQRNLIMASSPEGKLIFWRSITSGVPVARLSQGSPPLLSVIPFFSPQAYYSNITGIQAVHVGLEGSQFPVRNPRLVGVTRPFTFDAPDTETKAELQLAVEARVGRMFANAISYTIRVATWRDVGGNLWEPNTIITVTAPDAMIYEEYKFVVRTVEFNRSAKEETALINLVLPGSFNGGLPESLPWDL